MIENYSVAVKLSLVENVTKGLIALATQFGVLNKSATLLQAKMQAIRSQLMIGGMAVGFGTALIAPLLFATNQAGKLQQQMRFVQIATRASTDQMDAFNKTITHLATSSMFNVTDVATMAKTLGRAGNFNIDQLQALLPSFVGYAQTQNALSGTSYQKSTDQAIKLAEITGHFDPASIKLSLDALTKLSILMPGSVDKVLSAFKYMEGTMKNILGMTDEQSLILVGYMQRMGIEGTRAGNQLLQFIARSIPGVFGSGLWEGKSLPNLEAMGMLDANGIPKIFGKNGKVDPSKLFKGIGDFIAKDFQTLSPEAARTDILRRFQQTFGTTGTRIASMLTTPQAVSQFEEISEKYKRNPNLDQLIAQTSDLWTIQIKRMFSGISTVFTQLGYAILPDASVALSYFNDKLQVFADYIAHHQNMFKKIEEGIFALGGLAIIGGTLLILKAGFSALLLPIQLLTSILPVFTSALFLVQAPILPYILLLGALGVAFYEIYKHSDQVYNYLKNYKLFQWMADGFYYLGDASLHVLNAIIKSYNYVKDHIGFSKSSDIAALKSTDKPIFTDAINKTKGVAREAINTVKSVFSDITNPVKTLLGDVNNPSLASTIKNNAPPAPSNDNVFHPFNVFDLAANAGVNPSIYNYNSLNPNALTQYNSTAVNPDNIYNFDHSQDMGSVNHYQNDNSNTVYGDNKKSSITNTVYNGFSNNSKQTIPGSQNAGDTSTQPIQVMTSINLDGRKMAQAITTHMVGSASKVPNSASIFDSNLSPMPTNINNFGLGY